MPPIEFGKISKEKKQEEVQFHNIVVFGKQADTVQPIFEEGSSVLVEGRLQTRNWDAQDGTKKSKTEIVAERVQFGPRRQAGGFAEKGEVGAEKETPNRKEPLETIEYPEEDIKPEEIPFNFMKQCYFCANNIDSVDCKKAEVLKNF